MKIPLGLSLLLFAAASQAQSTPATCQEAPTEARALLDALHFREQFSAGMAISLPGVIRTEAGKAIGRNRDISDEKRRQIVARLGQRQPPVMDGIKAITDDKALMDCLMDDVAKAFARRFTAEEMQAITAFYLTPAGKALTEKMMLASADAKSTADRLLQPRISELAKKLENELLAP